MMFEHGSLIWLWALGIIILGFNVAFAIMRTWPRSTAGRRRTDEDATLPQE